MSSTQVRVVCHNNIFLRSINKYCFRLYHVRAGSARPVCRPYALVLLVHGAIFQGYLICRGCYCPLPSPVLPSGTAGPDDEYRRHAPTYFLLNTFAIGGVRNRPLTNPDSALALSQSATAADCGFIARR